MTARNKLLIAPHDADYAIEQTLKRLGGNLCTAR